MICHKHKFIFTRVSKTASTSMIYSLFDCYPHCDDVRIDTSGYWSEDPNHYPLSVTKQALSEDVYKKYFKFAFVRNPWDRAVSEYFYGLKWHKRNVHRQSHAQHPNLGEHRDTALPQKLSGGFENYIFNINGWKKKSLICQSDFTEGSDFIGRFENLQEDFDYVCDEIGKPRVELKLLNKTNHEQYREYYNKGTRRVIAEKFAKDIEYFGYKFGE